LAALLLQTIFPESDCLTVASRVVRKLLAAGPINTVFNLPAWPKCLSGRSADKHLFGAAHGTAGIAMALFQIGAAIGEARARAVGRDALFKLLEVSHTSRLGYFPRSTDLDQTPLTQWCHGLAGLIWSSRVFSQADKAIQDLRSDVSTTLLSINLPTPDTTYCHGLSGFLECLHTLSPAPPFQNMRKKIVTVLAKLHNADPIAPPWFSEHWGLSAPDFWIGSLSPAVALAKEESQLTCSVFDLDLFRS
jgi:hypothetical protein